MNLHCGEDHWIFYTEDKDSLTRDWIEEIEKQQRQAQENAEQEIQDAYKRAMDIVKR